MKFTKIPESTFRELQVNAGVILTAFDPAEGTLDMEALVTATTGGIKLDIVPTIEDFGSDVDNCPKNTKELARKTETDITMSCTALNFNEATVKLALGAAETRLADGAIELRTDLKQTDFKTIWFVGDLADGGFIAVKLIDALSTGGFTLQTSDKGKGKTGLTFKAFASLAEQDKAPVEIYLGEPEDEAVEPQNDNEDEE